MSHRIPIRKTAAAVTTVAAGVAVAAGVNVTGALGAPAAERPSTTSPDQPVRVVASFTRTADVDHVAIADGKRVADRRVAARHRARVAARHAAARRAARARAARRSASRSHTRTYTGDPHAIASAMMASRYGWRGSQVSCLNALWSHESGWNVHATNPSSGAYGIPQALPGSKMATMGSDWANNPATQIAWGLAYIRSSYGTPCGAWSAFQAKGWY